MPPLSWSVLVSFPLPLARAVSLVPMTPVNVVSPVPIMFHYSIVVAHMLLIILCIIVPFAVRTRIIPVGVFPVICPNFCYPGLRSMIFTLLPICRAIPCNHIVCFASVVLFMTDVFCLLFSSLLFISRSSLMTSLFVIVRCLISSLKSLISFCVFLVFI